MAHHSPHRLDTCFADEVGHVLEVQFKGGEIYNYLEVPAEKHAQLMSAESKGAYFYKHIRNGGFKFVRVA